MSLQRAKTITWEGRSCNHFPTETSDRGFIIYAEGGALVNLGGGDYKLFDDENKIDQRSQIRKVVADPQTGAGHDGNMWIFYHFDNFIKTIRGEATLNSPVDEACKECPLMPPHSNIP